MPENVPPRVPVSAGDVARLAPATGSRIAVVGAAGGIGSALVDALTAAECEVVALDLPASLAGWQPPAGVLSIPVDATDEASVSAAFARAAECDRPLDGFVCLAGFTAPRMSLAQMDPATFAEVLDGNLTSTYLTVRAALPQLRGDGAAVVLMSSGLGQKPAPGYGPYAAAKAGGLALTRLLAAECAPAIRVNAVAPGAVDTAFLRGGTGRSQRESGFNLDAHVATIPLGRMAVPQDVVGPILFLLGPASAYMTGQILHINGGLLMP